MNVTKAIDSPHRMHFLCSICILLHYPRCLECNLESEKCLALLIGDEVE